MDAIARPTEYGWRAFARYNLNSDGHDLYVAWRGQDRKVHAVSLAFTETAGLPMDAPTIGDAAGWTSEGVGGDSRGFLQCIMDAAWELGLRPKRLAEHQSELAAVRFHLEDMRKLAKVK
jgi:hypothetical protein